MCKVHGEGVTLVQRTCPGNPGQYALRTEVDLPLSVLDAVAAYHMQNPRMALRIGALAMMGAEGFKPCPPA